MQICFRFSKVCVFFEGLRKKKNHNTNKQTENNLAIEEENRLLICEIAVVSRCCLCSKSAREKWWRQETNY